LILVRRLTTRNMWEGHWRQTTVWRENTTKNTRNVSRTSAKSIQLKQKWTKFIFVPNFFVPHHPNKKELLVYIYVTPNMSFFHWRYHSLSFYSLFTLCLTTTIFPYSFFVYSFFVYFNQSRSKSNFHVWNLFISKIIYYSSSLFIILFLTCICANEPFIQSTFNGILYIKMFVFSDLYSANILFIHSTVVRSFVCLFFVTNRHFLHFLLLSVHFYQSS
jgi:hypothetical protein